MSTAAQVRASARHDQIEANFREALSPYTDAQLQVLAIDMIERPHVVEVQGLGAIAAIAVMFELERRKQAESEVAA